MTNAIRNIDWARTKRGVHGKDPFTKIFGKALVVPQVGTMSRSLPFKNSPSFGGYEGGAHDVYDSHMVDGTPTDDHFTDGTHQIPENEFWYWYNLDLRRNYPSFGRDPHNGPQFGRGYHGGRGLARSSGYRHTGHYGGFGPVGWFSYGWWPDSYVPYASYVPYDSSDPYGEGTILVDPDYFESMFGVDSRALPGAMFGTVLGFYSVAELHDLIRAKDVEMAQIGGQVVQSQDQSIKDDWARLNDAYQSARKMALDAIAHSLSVMPDNLNATANTDSAYHAIVNALQPVSGQVTPGSKQDIANRLVQAGWKPKYKVPQPSKTSDVDRTAYQKTDPANIKAALTFHVPRYVWVGGAVGLAALTFIALKVGLVAAKATPIGATLL